MALQHQTVLVDVLLPLVAPHPAVAVAVLGRVRACPLLAPAYGPVPDELGTRPGAEPRTVGHRRRPVPLELLAAVLTGANVHPLAHHAHVHGRHPDSANSARATAMFGPAVYICSVLNPIAAMRLAWIRTFTWN